MSESGDSFDFDKAEVISPDGEAMPVETTVQKVLRIEREIRSLEDIGDQSELDPGERVDAIKESARLMGERDALYEVMSRKQFAELKKARKGE